jgi:hypothetical protein
VSGPERSDAQQESGIRPGPLEEERRSWLAAAQSVVLTRWSLGVAVIALVVSVFFGATSCTAPESPGGSSNPGVSVSGTENTVTQNQVSGTCAQVADGSNCVVTLTQAVTKASQSSATDAEFKSELTKSATPAPADPGPWPFVVVDTGDLGLFARSGNEVNAERLGTALNRTIIWADCVATSSFAPADATGDNAVGPLWLKVRWAAVGPMQNSVSEPTEQATAWMYRGLAVPLQHNAEFGRWFSVQR